MNDWLPTAFRSVLFRKLSPSVIHVHCIFLDGVGHCEINAPQKFM